MSPTKAQQHNHWRKQINSARCEHQHGLRKHLQGLQNSQNTAIQDKFEKDLKRSINRTAELASSAPIVNFPEHLPVSQRHKEIADLISNNQVVILAGETGSGKTTQLPKICLSLSYGNKGLIGHTQPRRIAARTVAERIASEINTTLGDAVGYQVRFNDVSGDNTRVKLMTDGVLLAEFQRDRFLSKYEVIIVDEAHERSLNIDFLLGLLKPLCKQRPDLKIIITSATIDLQKFSQHFTLNGKPAPIIEVSGRTYPVETLYQPLESNGPSLPDVITETVSNVIRNEAKGLYKASGDILIFCAGEREIRDTALALRRAQLPIEVLPLYSRLSVGEQNRVFKPAHRRKVILATNVAETSITVPGIAYVIDPGVARISRYSFRSKIQRLPIEAISQASANQRKGRCGRVANGVCIRLYSEDDFISRVEFTQAEIIRSNLASVILKMLRLNVVDIANFDFIDRPDKRLLNDGYKLLEELNAINNKHKLTKVGRQMADLPVDPRYARILISANQLDCLQDALVLVSVLSIQDPRERPADKQQAADRAHTALLHHNSDFFSYLHLWQAINDNRAALSNSKFKKLCIERYWSIARIFEWRELYHQLAGLCKELGLRADRWHDITLPAEKKPIQKTNKLAFDSRYESIHKALLSGLLSNLASKDIDDQYTATRGRTIHLFPGSSQAKRRPKWLVASEFLETSRLFAHTIAEIKPQWVISSAEHLCKYSHSAPHYHARSGIVKALRKTLLYGLVLRDKESINYGPISPTECRTIFIQQALIDGNYKPSTKDNFLDHNQNLIGDIEKVETKTRRRNLLVSEQTVFDFYAERIPEDIYNRNSFEQWLKQGNTETLKLDRKQLLANEFEPQEVAQFPDEIEIHGKKVSIVYKFTPGQAQDGITMVIPISVLAPFPMHIGEWLVPGLLREKCIALLKTLPKQTRRNFAPAADAVDRVLHLLKPKNEALHKNLADQLFLARGVKIDEAMFDIGKLDQYYLMNYRVMDVDGSLIDEERDLALLKQRYAASVQKSIHADNAPERVKLERHKITEWDFGELTASVEYQHQGMTITAYPMLKERNDGSISLLVNGDSDTARYQTHNAILKLALSVLSQGPQKQTFRYLQKQLLASKNNSGAQSSVGLNNLATQLKSITPKQSDKAEWSSELILAGLKASCFETGLDSIRSTKPFNDALSNGAKNWLPRSLEIEEALLSALRYRDQLLKTVNATVADTVAIDEALEDIKAQIYQLFEPRFLRYTSHAQLKQYPRYLKAVESRLEKLRFASKSQTEEAALKVLQNKFKQKLHNSEYEVDFLYLNTPSLRDFATLLEEWRVSIYAQHLRTQIPVSEKRLNKAWKALSE